MLQSQPNIQMQQIFNLIYPVGSLYFSTVLDTVEKVQSTFGGTWEKLPEGYAIWTASSGAGDTIAPGLPNITGDFGAKTWKDDTLPTGVFVQTWYDANVTPRGDDKDKNIRISFDASRSSSIYGNSSTVQPPAYKVYAYKRLTLGGA